MSVLSVFIVLDLFIENAIIPCQKFIKNVQFEKSDLPQLFGIIL